MTRINVGIDPSRLSSKHLIAEHREIKRIPNQISKGKYSMDNQPSEFKLGTGHVKFFYDKCGYLLTRYKSLYLECVKRGFNVQDYSDAWLGVPIDMMNDYTVKPIDIKIIEERINERNSIRL